MQRNKSHFDTIENDRWGVTIGWDAIICFTGIGLVCSEICGVLRTDFHNQSTARSIQKARKLVHPNNKSYTNL